MKLGDSDDFVKKRREQKSPQSEGTAWAKSGGQKNWGIALVVGSNPRCWICQAEKHLPCLGLTVTLPIMQLTFNARR